MISLASLICEACKTLSRGLQEASFWLENCLRINLIASKFQKFPGGGGGGGGHAYARTGNLTPPNLMATALHTT